MSKEFCSKIYETTAEAYDIHRHTDPVIVQELFDQLNLRPGSTSLDMGCGSGNYTCALADN